MSSLNHIIDLSKNISYAENSPLKTLATEGLEKLTSMNIPTRRDENWKYTNLKSEFESQYKNITKSDNFDFQKREGFINLFFLDNHFVSEMSDTCPIEITSLDIVDPVFLTSNSQQIFKNDIVETLNKSFIQDGHIFTINSNIDSPIYIHRHFTNENGFYTLTNLYNIESNCQATILENITSEAPIYLNLASHVITLNNANLEHVQIQDTKHGSLVFNSIYGTVKEHGNYENVILNTGAKKSRTNLAISLIEPEARAHAHGLYALHADQHHDTFSYIHHDAPHTNSFQLYKGIMAENSRGIFTGKVRVEKDAQLINAEQLNKNLILSDKAQANSRPQLEIYADDVKCSHGSTTGQLSESELFYFESRGIRKDKARQMLARAFAYDVILKIKNLKVQDICKDHLINKHIVS